VLAPLFGFLGISYVTFRTLDVIICIRDGLVKALPPIRYFAFLLFFPTISSGPIDRYLRFSKDWERKRSRADLLADLDSAAAWLMQGFLYKFLLAAFIARHWMNPALRHGSFHAVVSYMYAYSLYLFFDFAGYSAFAVAFSHVLGVHTPRNFRLPFLARNIREFWERWHISLSMWFRDHIYTRFVMLAMKKKWFKSRYTASYLGFFLTMGLMGMWHGLALRYIVYGLYQATLLVGNDIFVRWNRSRGWLKGVAGEVAAIAITFNAVCFGLLIFSGRLF
jgi:membrane protein involved in D-alanine export